MDKIYNCIKCGKEMETSVIHPPHEGTRVFWHKDGTPDDCQNKVLVAVCKARDEAQAVITDRDEIISMLERALIEAGRPHQGMRSVPGSVIKEALNKLAEWRKNHE